MFFFIIIDISRLRTRPSSPSEQKHDHLATNDIINHK